MLEFLVVEVGFYGRHHCGCLHYRWLLFHQSLLHGFVEMDQVRAFQELRRDADVVRDRRRLLAIHRPEPRALRVHHFLQLFQGRLHHRPMLLRACNRGSERVDHRQPLGPRPRVIKDQEQHAYPEQQVRHQEHATRHPARQGRPVQVQEQQAQSQQPRPNLKSSPAISDQLNRRAHGQNPVGDFQRHPQQDFVRPIQQTRDRKRHHGAGDYEQRQNVFFSVAVQENGGPKQTHRQHKCRLRDGLELGRSRERRWIRTKPLRHTVGQPAQAPHQEEAFAKCPENQNSRGQHDESGRLLGCQLRDGELADRIPDTKWKVHCVSLA